MIDFRYHLISLIAVFLALGLGILMGSVVLSEKYVQRLERRVEDLAESLDASREEVSVLEGRVDGLQEFARESEALLVGEVLAGEEVVAFVLDGTDPALVDGISDSIEAAGGSLISTISTTDRFELSDQPERDQLALILGSTAATGGELREEAATQLGDRAAASAAATPGVSERSTGPARRLQVLLDDLQSEEFVGVSTREDVAVPSGASFVLIGGSTDAPPVGAVNFGLDLATALTGRGRAVLVAGPGDNAWQLIERMREDPAGVSVATVDHADTVPGRIAAVLGLQMAIDGVYDHYGTDSGATSILPPPTPDS